MSLCLRASRAAGGLRRSMSAERTCRGGRGEGRRRAEGVSERRARAAAKYFGFSIARRRSGDIDALIAGGGKNAPSCRLD